MVVFGCHFMGIKQQYDIADACIDICRLSFRIFMLALMLYCQYNTVLNHYYHMIIYHSIQYVNT